MRQAIFLYKMLKADLIQKLDIRAICTKYPQYGYKLIKHACIDIVSMHVDPSHITLHRVLIGLTLYIRRFEAIIAYHGQNRLTIDPQDKEA